MTNDIRAAIRKLRAEPGVTLAILAALGFGLGINTAVFTLVHAVLIRGLPFPDAARILYVSGERLDREDRSGISLPELRDFRQQSRVFEKLAAFSGVEFNLSDPQQPPENFRGASITANAFSITSIRPILGRDFTADDEKPGSPPVAILGHSVWQNRYGADPNIVGRAVRIDGSPVTVIGVMPTGFRFPVAHDVWMPLRPTNDLEKRTDRRLGVFGLIAPSASIADARAEATVIADRLRSSWPKENENRTFFVRTFNETFNGGNIRAVFLLMAGAVGFVVLIVCANVANLLLARSVTRTREIALRMAMGASRSRIIRQLLIECMVLAFAGGIAGLSVAWVGVRAFSLAVANVGKPYWIEFQLEPAVFAFLAVLCIGCSILFGMAPALRLSRVDLNGALKQGERGSGGSIGARWFTGAMVSAQIALALVLLAGAGFMASSFLTAARVDAGLDTAHWLTGQLNLSQPIYEKPEARIRFLDSALARVRAIPGVESASLVTIPPLLGAYGWRFEIEGRPQPDDAKWPAADGILMSDGFFETLAKPILRGRANNALDGDPGHQTVIVNQVFAQRFFPDQDPIGRRIRLQMDGRPWLTIAGIAPSIRTSPRDRPDPEAVIYLPFHQSPGRRWHVFVRTSPPLMTAVSTALRKEIQALDMDLPVANVKPFRQTLRESNWAFRVFSTIFAVFALFALLLAAVGLYAVIAYSVNQRVREIGIRMALGAGASTILAWVLRRGAVPVAVGLAIGIAGGIAVSKLLASTQLLVGRRADPYAFALVAILLAATSLLAMWLPARRASRVDPLAALREQ